MRLHGLLSFYDEPVPSLVACVKGLHQAGVDHIVAVDGAYALYPDAQAASHPNQHAAIHLACRELGMACTLHVPSRPWQGNEVEKRTFLFDLAWACADEGDWFWVQDADMFVTEAPADLKERLAVTESRTAEVNIIDIPAVQAKQADWPETFVLRSLFKAQPITVGPAHCNYTAEDGTELWAGTGWDANAPTCDLSDVVTVEHRPDARPHDRQVAKLRYYADRDASGIERGLCECGVRASSIVPVRWRWSDLGPVAEWQEVCPSCLPRVEREAADALCALGVDPDSVRVENRNGHIPERSTL